MAPKIELHYHYPNVFSRDDYYNMANKFAEILKQMRLLDGGRRVDVEEWSVVDIHKDVDNHQCICSYRGLKTDFILCNNITGTQISIGSSCIKLFKNERLDYEVLLVQKEKCAGGHPILKKSTRNGRVGKCDASECKVCRPQPPAPPPPAPAPQQPRPWVCWKLPPTTTCLFAK